MKIVITKRTKELDSTWHVYNVNHLCAVTNLLFKCKSCCV